MSIRASNKLLDELCRKTALTPQGKAWFIEAVDPFHDTDLSLAGYPDMMSSSTVVQVIKQQTQITAPTSIATGANWDCSIALMPNSTGFSLSNFNTVNDGVSISATTATTTVPFFPLSIQAGPQNAAMYPVAGSSVANTVQTVATLSPFNYAKGQFRVIAAGFEVVNTTAQQFQQGQVTVWRQPTILQENNYNISAVNAGSMGQSYRTQKLLLPPPATIAGCQQLFGSRSWNASEGAYVVARQNSALNSTKPNELASYGFIDRDLTGNQMHYTYTPSGPATIACSNFDKINPFDMSGAHFTGLSNQTSLVVNVRWIIERIPTASEPDLVVMASPSSIYDPVAMSLVSEAFSRAPPGVMLRENPLGEWFRSAVSAVADWAPKIGASLGSLGVPMAASIGQLVGNGAGLVSGIVGRNPVQASPVPLIGSSSSGNTMPVALRPKPKKKIKPYKNTGVVLKSRVQKRK